MSEHQYILEKYKGPATRYSCPECNVKRKFTRYIDTDTGEHISDEVGKCDREINCGYHYKPKQYFEDNKIAFVKPDKSLKRSERNSTPLQKQISFISQEVFKASLKNYEANNFTNYLNSLFGNEKTNELIERYLIGTSKHFQGATVFWQRDKQGNIRTGKIMSYNAITGKRIKEPHDLINWVHSVLKTPDYELSQCFFGEHLLIDKTKTVAIVESEKTAIISSVYLPEFIWIAAGSLKGLNANKCKVLQGRKVILYPDLNAFNEWNIKRLELSNIARFTITDLLERNATEQDKINGLDIADYLLKPKNKEIEIPKTEIKNDDNELKQSFFSLPTNDWHEANRPFFIENTLLNIQKGFSRTLIQDKENTETKQKYLRLYLNDIKHIAEPYKVTINDFNIFLQ
jgi:hypothetical protein